MPLYITLGLLLPLCVLGLAACAPSEDNEPADPALSPGNESPLPLPEPLLVGDTSLEETLEARRSVRAFRDEPLGLEAVAQLLWSAQGVSDEGRGFRTAPSAGATYPLETYLVAGSVDGLEPGVYRYDPDTHTIALTVAGDVRGDLAAAALSQRFIAEAPATVVFACVYARTAGRYGERAERYVHMEAGHAAQNLSLQSVALGLGTVPVGAFDDDRVASLLELPRDEAPLYVLPVGRP